MPDGFKNVLAWNQRFTKVLEAIDRDSRQGVKERLLAGTQHAVKAAERRRRRLADSQAELAALEKDAGLADVAAITKSVDEDADLATALEAAIADVLEVLDGDSNQAAALVERLRGVVDRVQVLLERAKTISPIAPKAALENSISNEIGRALGLAGKIRALRGER